MTLYFEVYLIMKNNDTLFLEALYQENYQISLKAFGFKTSGPNTNNNGQIITHINDSVNPI